MYIHDHARLKMIVEQKARIQAQGLFFLRLKAVRPETLPRPPRQSDRRSLRSPQTGKHQAQSIAALTSAQSPHALGAGAASSGSRALPARRTLAVARPRCAGTPATISPPGIPRLLPPVLLFDSFLPGRRPPFSAWTRDGLVAARGWRAAAAAQPSSLIGDFWVIVCVCVLWLFDLGFLDDCLTLHYRLLNLLNRGATCTELLNIFLPNCL